MKLLGNIVGAVLFLFGVGWVFYRALKSSDDPARLIFKWVLTAGVIAFMILVVVPLMRRGGYEAAFGGVPLAAVCGLTLAIIWRHSLTGMIAMPFGSLYDGGDQEFEARAFYSAAEKFRQRNQFHEAITEVRKQLEKFPSDFGGQMLLAEINAENLQDLQSAEIIIQKIVNQPARSPAQIAGALHALADWHMKLAQDPDSARLALEQIIERLPDSPFSQMASQRIAHLGSVDSLLATHERPAIALKHFDPYANLQKGTAESAESLAQDAAMRADVCVKQLEQYPLDTEAREKLAKIYANEQKRLDLATEQMEQLISQPNQRPRQVTRWLNLLAELQIKIGNDVSSADKTVRRIRDLFPGTAAAEQATIRLEYLRLEAKRNEQTESVKLGSYEKDMGLKKPAA
ncbi:MAG: tetratricopeptide repeat protein [Verrucomicrobiota bacterium]